MSIKIAFPPRPADTEKMCCTCCGPFVWGEEWQLGSAAFWVQQAAQFSSGVGRHRLGDSLREEVAACILGGYGISGPLGNAAFAALRDAGLLAEGLAEDIAEMEMSKVLSMPLHVDGRRRTYRFHRQRPRRLAAALSALSVWEADASLLEDHALRDRLMTLPGVGPKTASWVVRNHRDSNAVAIIDIHIQRAGIKAGVFCARWTLPRDYDRFESAFLDWALSGAVSAADLDAVIWRLLSALAQPGRILVR